LNVDARQWYKALRDRPSHSGTSSVEANQKEKAQQLAHRLLRPDAVLNTSEEFECAYSEWLLLVKNEVLASINDDIPPRSKSRLWLLEIWIENRELFKQFVTHALLFGLFLVSLETFHRLVEKSTLDPQNIDLLNQFHFYSHFVTLVLFALNFIIKVTFKVFKELFEKKP
jgi:ABC-type bacteriocin/lantibiotic exporter with double-glycine peptidase domain